jgi:integrase/recombinase XerD
MATTTAITLRSEENKDGKHSLMLRITHDRQVSTITLNESVLKKDFDEAAMQIKKSCKYIPNRDGFNAQLHDYLTRLRKFINHLEAEGKLVNITAKQIRALYLNNGTETSIATYTLALVANYNNVGQFSNASVYKQSISFLTRYSGIEEITFKQFDKKMLSAIQMRYLAKGFSENGLSVYMRTLRAIYNHAIKDGVAKAEWYPFKDYEIPQMNTFKCYITKAQVHVLANYPVPENSTTWHCRNWWLFLYYCNGMSIADLARLRKSNLQGSHITYVRTKTRRKKQEKPIVVKVPEAAFNILKYYTAGKKESDFLFPIIANPDKPEKWRTDIHNASRQITKYLNKIGAELQITTNFTPGIARHSWANAAREATSNNKIIQQALGHSSITTTEIYMGSFANSDIDELTELVSTY